MMVTMRSIMRLSGPPRPPKLPLPGAGPDGLPCPYAGAIDAPLLQQAALAISSHTSDLCWHGLT